MMTSIQASPAAGLIVLVDQQTKLMSGHMRKMTINFYTGLTKMAGIKHLAAADFFSSSSDSAGGSSAKKAVYQIYFRKVASMLLRDPFIQLRAGEFLQGTDANTFYKQYNTNLPHGLCRFAAHSEAR